MSTVDQIEEMLSDPARLFPKELCWVHRIDEYLAEFDPDRDPSSRQAEVIADIYAKFSAREGEVKHVVL